MENLAYIGKVVKLDDIEKADRLISATIVCGSGGKWRAVMPLDTKLDDTVVVFLQDAIVPQREETSFLKDNRIKIRKFRGAASECLALHVFEELKHIEVGVDVTQLLGVEKYEKPLPPGMNTDAIGAFPVFIPRTDEDNWQTVPEVVEDVAGMQLVGTEKEDGTSITTYYKDGHVGVCSRNLEKKEDDSFWPWWFVHHRKLDKRLSELNKNIALQGELVGPKIQGNPLGLKQMELRFFDLYDIDTHEYLLRSELEALCDAFGLQCVPIVWQGTVEHDEDLSLLAEGKYPSGKQREGIVIRPRYTVYNAFGRRLSFKVINPLYKD